MSYTLSNLVSQVQSRLDDTGFSSTTIKQFINDTQREITNDKRWRFMEATTNLTSSVGSQSIGSFPADYQIAIDLRISSPVAYAKKLPFLDYTVVDEQYSDQTIYANSTPMFWYEYANVPYIFPQADQVYTLTLRYLKTPTELSADADVPQIPEEYQELLVLGALSRCHELNDDYDKAAIVRQKIDELLISMTKRYGFRLLDGPRIMRAGS